MRCDKVMKRDIQALRPEDSVHLAARIMRDAGVGFLPVIDSQSKVLGTLTDRDIVLRVCAEDRPHATPVSEVFTRECVAVRPEDDLSRAETLMSAHRKSRILVTAEDGLLCGVISLSDVADVEKGAIAAQTLHDVASREVHPQPPPHEAPGKGRREPPRPHTASGREPVLPDDVEPNGPSHKPRQAWM